MPDVIGYFLLIAVLAQFVVLAVIFHKVRRVHLLGFTLQRNIHDAAEQLSRQLQFTAQLQDELALPHPLPPMRGWAASPDYLLHLVRYCRTARPQRIVECGSGISTIVLARCCQQQGAGHVTSLDQDARFAAQTREELVRFGLSDWATVIDAPMQTHTLEGEEWQWYAKDAVPSGPFDLVNVDGPVSVFAGKPLARYPAGPLLIAKLDPAGAAFLDDSDRPGEQDVVRRWLATMPRLEQTQLYAEKGCVRLSVKSA